MCASSRPPATASSKGLNASRRSMCTPAGTCGLPWMRYMPIMHVWRSTQTLQGPARCPLMRSEPAGTLACPRRVQQVCQSAEAMQGL